MNIQKLLPHEFRKYFSRFNLLFLAAVLLLELGVSLYRNRTFFRAEYREYKRETERLVEMYASDRASYDAIHTEYEQRLSAYNEDLMASDITNEIPVFESRYLENALYDDRALFSAVEKAVRTPGNLSETGTRASGPRRSGDSHSRRANCRFRPQAEDRHPKLHRKDRV